MSDSKRGGGLQLKDACGVKYLYKDHSRCFDFKTSNTGYVASLRTNTDYLTFNDVLPYCRAANCCCFKLTQYLHFVISQTESTFFTEDILRYHFRKSAGVANIINDG